MDKKNAFFAVAMMGADALLLIAFIAVGPDILQNLAGYDVTVYENWNGELANPVVYRFGAGCWEYTIVFLRLLAFLAIQTVVTIKKQYSKKIWIVAIVAHTIICALGAVFVYRYADGNNIFYLVQYLLFPWKR
ncbi:MAG: hypothetical protein PUC73_00205 [Lachnospiraceae bacterium]|nr:hypothetical protein [Lachnospiraceae bacterium]